MELIGRSYNEAQNTNKRITLSFIVRKYVKVTWDGLKYLKKELGGWRESGSLYVKSYRCLGSCTRELSTCQQVNVRVR